MSPWRLAGSLEVLRHEVNARWPDRSKVSDGTIGDAAHASTGSSSDHNPWLTDDKGTPVVRAFDITSVSIDADWLAEHLRQLGAAGDPRLADHGYVIWAGRIASATQSWWWRQYTGADPHTSHIHVSVARDQAGYDSPATWLLKEPDGGAVPQPEEDDFMAKLMRTPNGDVWCVSAAGRWHIQDAAQELPLVEWNIIKGTDQTQVTPEQLPGFLLIPEIKTA